MSFFRRAMVYLGLVDDDYDDYEPYDETQQMAAPARQQMAPVPQAAAEPMTDPMAGSSIRTLPREPSPMAAPPPPPMAEPMPSAMGPVSGGLGTMTSGVSVQPRPSVVRPIVPVPSPKVHVVEPAGFGDAQEIGDRLKAGQPVIVSLQAVDPDLSRRLIDFCSGATYALGGAMERVAKNVFLLTPLNVEVSPEEKRRLQERGLYRS